MRSTHLVNVVEKLRHMDKLNRDMKYLDTATCIHFADASEQRRISIETRTLYGRMLRECLQKGYELERRLLVDDLANMGVDYDG